MKFKNKKIFIPNRILAARVKREKDHIRAQIEFLKRAKNQAISKKYSGEIDDL